MHRSRVGFRSMVQVAAVACSALILALAGCSEDCPEAPDVYIVQEGGSDDGSEMTEFIPSGAKFFSLYVDGDGTIADLYDTANGLSTFSRVLISRIDYRVIYTVSGIPQFRFVEASTSGIVLKRYELPLPYVGGTQIFSGTITLTYPIDGSTVGGGISFDIGSGINDGQVGGICLAGANDDDFAVVFGYAWNP